MSGTSSSGSSTAGLAPFGPTARRCLRGCSSVTRPVSPTPVFHGISPGDTAAVTVVLAWLELLAMVTVLLVLVLRHGPG